MWGISSLCFVSVIAQAFTNCCPHLDHCHHCHLGMVEFAYSVLFKILLGTTTADHC
jgi:hypothetical protein